MWSGLASSFWSRVALAPTRRALTEAQQSEIRALGLMQIRLLLPMMVGAAFFDILTIDIVFWSEARTVFLALWTGCAAAVVASWAIFWRKLVAKRVTRGAQAKDVRHLALLMTMLGGVWTIPFILFFPESSEAQRVVMVANATGMIASGAIALAPVWQAALLYQAALVIPSVWVLLENGEPLYYYLILMAAVFLTKLVHLVWERGRFMVDTYLAAADMREQGQVISLLLKEFEENASDWLFELDSNGRLARCGERLAAILAQPHQSLVNLDMLGLIDLSTADGVAAKTELQKQWRSRLAVRDLIVPVRIGGARRWWSITAKPTFSPNGAFMGYRGVGSDVTAARKAESELERLARFDPLTGLANRAYFNEGLEAALAEPSAGPIAVVSLDLDRFKAVNDTLGHPMGDALLVRVAERLKLICRESDIVARIGGDEFVILLPQTGDEAAKAFARRIIETIGERFDINGYRIQVGASVGVAFAGEHGGDAEAALRASDLALYRAKSEGKGRYCLFSPDMAAAMETRRELEIELRDALQNGEEIETHFQPIVDAETGAVVGFEALARWSHPWRGSVPPSEFVPIAEETGLIVQLGECVLRAACREAATWRFGLRVSVNVSAAQFKTDAFVERVRQILEETSLEPSRLEFEITESILIEDREDAFKTLTELRALGVSCALDDFGIGFSSLSYLSAFPFSKIKIDRSFVREVELRPEAAAIIRAIISLANALGMTTTAEGVETEAERDYLRAQGCRQMQGYLFSQALPGAGARAFAGGTRSVVREAEAA
jgi:diguanylate cyclase (GGDEF)-like protein